VDANIQKSRQFFLDLEFKNGTISGLTPEIAKHAKVLWADSGVQNAFHNRSKFQLSDSCDYFMDRVDELSKPGYLPNEQDIFRVRVRTTGIIENDFVIDRNRFKMIDVGGQRNERKKWIHCFEGVRAVIYVVDINAYDCMLFEDDKVNRMEEALNLFESTCNSKFFKDTAIILFLNKSDLFQEKIKKVPLTVTFPDYTGENTYEAGIAFLEAEFVKRNHYKKPIYCHATCATDTRVVSAVFNGVKDIVVREALTKSGLI